MKKDREEVYMYEVLDELTVEITADKLANYLYINNYDYAMEMLDGLQREELNRGLEELDRILEDFGR